MKLSTVSCQALLVSTMLAHLAGCSSTSSTLARWTGRGTESQVAEKSTKPSSKPITPEKSAAAKAVAKKDSVKSLFDEDPFQVDESVGVAKSKAPAKKPATTTVAKTESSFLDEDWSDAQSAGRQAIDTLIKGAKKDAQEVTQTDGKTAAEKTEKSIAALDRKLADVRTTHTVQSAKKEIHRFLPDELLEEDEAAGHATVAQGTAGENVVPEKSAVTPVSGTASTKVIPAEATAKIKSLVSKGEQALPLLALCPQATGQVKDLIAALDTKDLEKTKKATYELGQLGSRALAAAPALTKLMLEHPNGFVRVNCAMALSRIGGCSPQAVDTLVKALKDPDPGVRSYSAAVLAGLGPKAEEAIPALTEALNDPDANVRLHVAEVLIRYDQWSQPALKALLSCLDDKDENVRWLTTYSLAELAPQSAEVVQALRFSLSDPVEKVRVGAIYALGELGPMAMPAEPEIRALTQDGSDEVRRTAEQSLRLIRRG